MTFDFAVKRVTQMVILLAFTTFTAKHFNGLDSQRLIVLLFRSVFINTTQGHDLEVHKLVQNNSNHGGKKSQSAGNMDVPAKTNSGVQHHVNSQCHVSSPFRRENHLPTSKFPYGSSISFIENASRVY